MRKKAIIFPAAAAVLGVAGALIRFAVVNTVYDEYGKVTVGHPAVSVMTIYAVICCLLMVVFAFISTSKAKYMTVFYSIIPSVSLSQRVIMTVLGIMMSVTSLMYYASTDSTALDTLYTLFGVLSGLSVIVIPWSVGKSGSSFTRCVFSLFPSIFACLWLIILYRANAGNPELFEYGMQCIAIAAIALSYFYIGGFIFGEGKYRRTVGSCLIATLMCFISVADNTGMQRFFYIIHGIALCLISIKFLSCPEPEISAATVIVSSDENNADAQ